MTATYEAPEALFSVESLVHPPTELVLPARLASKIEHADSGCWLWIGQIDSEGYGRLSHSRAHRLVFAELVGPIPDGLELDHLCRVRNCVNPMHLEPVDHRTNVLRGAGTAARHAAARACPQGHPYDEANTGRNSRGWRRCLACHREKSRARNAALREVRA